MVERQLDSCRSEVDVEKSHLDLKEEAKLNKFLENGCGCST